MQNMNGLQKSNRFVLILVSFIGFYSANMESYCQSRTSIPYVWKSVQIVGGGFVDGIIFHPTEKGLCYCRTDMGGAYRRNSKTLRWEPLLDWIPYKDANLMGVESIALDPSDPDWLFLACGTYTGSWAPDGAILRSNDRGKTFKRSDVPFKMGANEDGRGNGERMAVDPNDGNIVYLGTRHAGLWKSTDRAVTWNRVESFPDITEKAPVNIHSQDSIDRWLRMNQGCGIDLVLFDPGSGSSVKKSSVIYVGVSLMNYENLFRSVDGGKTWQAVPGQPVQYLPTHAVLASNGNIYITYGNAPGPSRMTDGAVWKLNTKTGQWTDITPDKPDQKNRAFGYAAVSVETQNPLVVIASTYHRYGIANGEDIFRSLDGGKSWKPVFANPVTMDSSLAPYTARTGIHWLFDIEIDPSNPDHAMFTTGYGGHETFNLSDMDKNKPTKWNIMSTGIEETVALELLSPTKGAPLITAIGDYCGFVHWDLDRPSPEGSFDNPRFGNTNSVACAENNPDIIVRVGRATNYNPGKNIGYSMDGGKSWKPAPTMPTPDCSLGHIAVSSNGTSWIWSPDPIRTGYGPGRTQQFLPVYVTTDMGANWMECKGIPNNTRVISDPVNPKRFYAIDLFAGKLFVSSDGGSTFSEHALILPGGLPQGKGYRGDNRGGQDRIYASADKEGDLWIAAFDGLYHSVDMGQTFTKFNDIQEVHAFGFGKSAPASIYSALYLVGTVNSVRGIFRSDDTGLNWIRINDDLHQWGLILHVTGDPKVYGRVYVGTHGRGILYGDPVNK
jgi:hypothetical protein